ncbi:MmyB family transcriptional regulator, partial [Kineococcus indalonis]
WAQLSTHLLHLLEAMTGAPAFVRNGRLDVLAATALARALYSPAFEEPPAGASSRGTGSGTGAGSSSAGEPVNLARFCFLDPHAEDFYPNWNDAAGTTIALLRTEASRDPHDEDLTALVGELSLRSEDFRIRWAAHEVRLHRSGTKSFDHPVVGRLQLSFEAFPVTSDAPLTLTTYTAPPASPAADALTLLASWTATRAVEAAASSTQGPTRSAPTGRRTQGERARRRPDHPLKQNTVELQHPRPTVKTPASAFTRAGDTVVCPPGEEHWHGATADTFMSHFALLEAGPDGSNPTTWLEAVPDEQYAAAQPHAPAAPTDTTDHPGHEDPRA